MTQSIRRIALWTSLALLSPVFSSAVDFKETPGQPGVQRVVPVVTPQIPGADLAKGIADPTKIAGPAAGLTVPVATPGAQAKADVVAPVVAGVQPQLEAIAKPGAGNEASAGATANVATVLQGGKPAETAGVVVAASPGNAGPATAPLAKNDGAKASAPTAPAAPSAPAAKAPKAINSMARYKATRWALGAIATHFGIVYSLPPATPALTQRILETKAREAQVFFSDIDDTLTKFNTKLPRSQAENIEGVDAAGKTFAAITDRPDKTKAGSSTMGALETMSELRQDKRAGVIVATNGGGKIYEYDKSGEPQLIYEEPPLPETERPLINEAAEVVKAQLAANGTAIFEKNPGGPGPYGHSMIFNGGTPEATVKKLAHAFEAELRKRGLDYEVEGRMAKDPSLPPYITFSKLNKSLAVQRIIEVKKLQGKKMVGMGDSMYAPVKPSELTGWKKRWAPTAMRLGRALSGQDIPLTGNRTDANMEHGNRGMTMLSVGLTGDPRMTDGWVLAGKGPGQSAQILIEAARKPKSSSGALQTAAAVVAFLAVLAALGVFVYVVGHAVGDMAGAVEQEFHSLPNNGNWPF
ncbi:MAG: hypothetical protein HY077_07035 [Elusimicrobia bacterium]|nr:hypothetical protein [Elusimicrobiota bacterium]